MKQDRRQAPKCPPPLVRKTPGGPCVPRGFAAPLGGPASGLWPSGGRGSVRAPAPSPSPTPVPPPIVCITADIFADCFAGCSGTIDAGTPGPICGWTWSKGVNGGEVIFTPGSMADHGTAGTDDAGARKNLDQAILSVSNLTIQSTFTEYPLSGTGMYYEWILTNTGNTQRVYLGLFGDGFVAVRAGPAGSSRRYTGAWTPNMGTHKVQVLVDPANNVSLYIDDVPIALTFIGTGSLAGGGLPGNVVQISSSPDSAPVINASAIYTKMFVASGLFIPPTLFCCP